MKMKLLILALLILITTTGCARYNEAENNDDTPHQKDNQSSIAKADVEIVLEENPTTGYEWHYELEPEGIVEVVKDEYVHGGSDADGAGGKHIWGLKGIKEGSATMIFKSYRDGDDEEYNKDPITYVITVDSKGKIVETKEGTSP